MFPFSRADASPVILILGDSLSAAYGMDSALGWVNQLQTRLQQQGYPHKVVNASISGDTTSGGLSRLPEALKHFKPSILVIELGANDGLRGFDLEQISNNLQRMIELARVSDARVLLIGMMLPPNFGKIFTQKFQQLYQQISVDENTALLPFLLDGVAQRQQWMQDDGLHPNAQGQPRMLENVWPHLRPLLEATRSTDR